MCFTLYIGPPYKSVDGFLLELSVCSFNYLEIAAELKTVLDVTV